MYNGKTWCREHVKQGVGRYLKYKKLENKLKNKVGISCMRKIHLGRLSTKDVKKWSTRKLEEVKDAVLKSIQLRREYSELCYAAIHNTEDHAAVVHRLAIQSRLTSSETMNTVLWNRSNSRNKNNTTSLVLYDPCANDDDDDDDDEDYEEEEEEEENPDQKEAQQEQEQEQEEQKTKKHQKGTTDEELNEILEEMELMDQDEEDRTLTIRELAGCYCGVNKAYNAMKLFPNDLEWSKLVGNVFASTTRRVYTETGEIRVELYPFHAFPFTIVDEECAFDHALTLFLSLPVQREMRRMASMVLVALAIEDEDSDLEMDELVDVMFETFDQGELADSHPCLCFPHEWFVSLFEVVAPSLSNMAMVLETESFGADYEDILDMLIMTFFTRCALLVFTRHPEDESKTKPNENENEEEAAEEVKQQQQLHGQENERAELCTGRCDKCSKLIYS